MIKNNKTNTNESTIAYGLQECVENKLQKAYCEQSTTKNIHTKGHIQTMMSLTNKDQKVEDVPKKVLYADVTRRTRLLHKTAMCVRK